MRLICSNTIRALSVGALALTLAVGCGKKETPQTPPPAATAAPVATAQGAPDVGEAAEPDEAREPRRGIEDDDAARPEESPTEEAVAEPSQPTQVPRDRREALDLWAALKPGVAARADGLRGASGLAQLPANALATLAFGDPMTAMNTLGLPQLRATFSAEMAEVSGELVKTLGRDLLDPAAWADMGIDLGKPAGIALFNGRRDPRVATFFTVGDRAKLDAALDDLATRVGRKLERATVGEATVVTLEREEDVAVVLRGDVMTVVSGDDEVPELARAIAGTTEATSIVTTSEYADAVAKLQFSDHAVGWVNARAFANVAMRLNRDVDELGRRGKAERQMMENLLDGVSGLAMGARMDERSIEASLFMPLKKGSLLHRLPVNLTGHPAVLVATDETPAILFGGRIDIPAYVELVGAALESEGASMDELRAQVREMTKLDLDKDVFGAFSGEFGFALHADMKRIMGGESPETVMTGSIVLGLAKADVAKSLMMTAMGLLKGQVDGLEVDDATGVISMGLPTGGRVYVGVQGDHLVASLDKGFAARIASKDLSGSFVSKLEDAKLAALLKTPGQAAYGMLQHGFTTGMFLFSSPANAPMMRTEPLGEDATAEQKAAQKRIVAIQAELEKLATKERERQEALMTTMVEKLGVLAQTVRKDDAGLSAIMGQYFGATIGDVVTTIAVQGAKDGDDSDKRWELQDELWELQRKLEGEATEVVPDEPDDDDQE